uniref:Uncharacterized protein n=1 Tax=Oryza punctata TaxID=4537 RepID=A0A0E0KFQ2_ORYPU
MRRWRGGTGSPWRCCGRASQRCSMTPPTTQAQPLKVFIVSYLAPAEAPLIISTIEKLKTKEAYDDEDVPDTISRVIVINQNLLDSKDKARLDITAEISRVKDVRDNNYKRHHNQDPSSPPNDHLPADKDKESPRILKVISRTSRSDICSPTWALENGNQHSGIRRQSITPVIKGKGRGGGEEHDATDSRRPGAKIRWESPECSRDRARITFTAVSKWEHWKERPLPPLDAELTVAVAGAIDDQNTAMRKKLKQAEAERRAMLNKLKQHMKKLRKLLYKQTLIGVGTLAWAEPEPVPTTTTSSGRSVKSNARFTGSEWTA